MKTSFQQYRRLGTVGYAQWLCAVNDVQFNDEMITLTDRDSIERYVSSVLSPVQDTLRVSRLVDVKVSAKLMNYL